MISQLFCAVLFMTVCAQCCAHTSHMSEQFLQLTVGLGLDVAFYVYLY